MPRKNILALVGHPLIAYTIWAAQGAQLLTDYLVTTEDEEILEIAQSYGAPTPFVRPAELAADEVRNIETVLHALRFMEEKSGKPYDVVVLLQPTCPIRDPRHIDEAITRLWCSDLDTSASVKGPYQKRDPILKRVNNGVLEDYCESKIDDPREPFYIYNASVYAVKRDYLVQERKLISPKQVPLVMDQFHSVDIDTESDLVIAEACLKHLDSHRRKELE